MAHQTTDKLNTHMPLLVVVSGAPGTGKTTLAAKIAHEMRLLHLERDIFFSSLEQAAGGRQINRSTVGVTLFYKAVSNLLKSGVSLVIDSTLYKDISEANTIQLKKLANVVNV